MPSATRPLSPLVDPFGRHITYLRLSVTDRCDLRCTYCMPERMEFLPKREVLSLEELERLALAFIRRGVRKIRLTGGEPLVRRDILRLIARLGSLVWLPDPVSWPAGSRPSSKQISDATGPGSWMARSGRAMTQEGEGLQPAFGLEELTLTTNGTQLARHAAALEEAGVRRINVSLDSLDPDRFRAITRRGDLEQVMEGIDAALTAGLRIKINMVALKGINENEIAPMVLWAHGRGMDVTLIETMPMGEIAQRAENYLSLKTVRERLAREWTLTDLPERTGGPARYVRVEETGGRLGLITPLSHNFCEACNRVRVTCTGEMFMCLGRDASADLRTPLRASASDALLDAAIDEAISRKPKGHDFDATRLAKPAVARAMSLTGG